MNLRLSLLELAKDQRLNAPDTARLLQGAGLSEAPHALALWLPRGVAVLAAALGGFGLMLWIAANWDTWGRVGHFALLQGLVLSTGLGASLLRPARPALGLLALLGIGGLFAYFGQTYQTGADAWQLFALWGVLSLPLCLGARSDVLWAPWALVMMTAITLWAETYSGQHWSVRPEDMRVHTLAWAAMLLVTIALSRVGQSRTGAGPWSFRTATCLAVVAITFTAISGLFFHRSVAPQYPLGVLLLALCAALLCSRAFEVFALSAVALGLNALLVAGLIRWLGDGAWDDDWIGRLLLVGLFAAALLAGSVNLILRMSRRHATTPGAVA